MNVIQWMYKKEQVQTTWSKIIQWLTDLLSASNFQHMSAIFIYSTLIVLTGSLKAVLID